MVSRITPVKLVAYCLPYDHRVLYIGQLGQGFNLWSQESRPRERRVPALMRLCFVKAGPSRPTVCSPAIVIKAKPLVVRTTVVCGVWQWCREELRLVHTIQHTNNTHTVEQQWELFTLPLIIDIQARPTVCTPPAP